MDSLTLEKRFDQFFEGLEFKRVTSTVGLSPDFRNADYMHEGMKVIVELKILEKDYFKNGGVIDRFHQLVVIPERVDKNGLGVYRTIMPPPGKSTFEEPLGQLLKGANRQLKETKQHIFKGQGYGFVLLALNKFRSLSPAKTFDLVCSTLEQKAFSSIDGFMLCTPL
jgi:hypothetical protein